VEYSVNDEAHPSPPMDNPQRRAFERLLRKLLRMPRGPAVVLVSAYAYHMSRPPGQYWANAEADYFEFATFYQLPLLSLKAAVFHALVANKPPFLVSGSVVDDPSLKARRRRRGCLPACLSAHAAPCAPPPPPPPPLLSFAPRSLTHACQPPTPYPLRTHTRARAHVHHPAGRRLLPRPHPPRRPDGAPRAGGARAAPAEHDGAGAARGGRGGGARSAAGGGGGGAGRALQSLPDDGARFHPRPDDPRQL